MFQVVVILRGADRRVRALDQLRIETSRCRKRRADRGQQRVQMVNYSTDTTGQVRRKGLGAFALARRTRLMATVCVQHTADPHMPCRGQTEPRVVKTLGAGAPSSTKLSACERGGALRDAGLPVQITPGLLGPLHRAVRDSDGWVTDRRWVSGPIMGTSPTGNAALAERFQQGRHARTS